MPVLSSGTKFHTQGYRVASIAAGASATVLYTCPPNYGAIARYLHVSNSDTATRKIFIQFYHSEDNAYHYLANGFSMAGNSVANFVNGGYFNLHKGDKIVAYGDTANVFDILVSFEEYYNPQFKG